MSAVEARPFDYQLLAGRLDLEPADTLDDQVRVLQETRVDLLADLNARVDQEWPEKLLELVGYLNDCRRADIALIEEALIAAGEPLDLPSTETEL